MKWGEKLFFVEFCPLLIDHQLCEIWVNSKSKRATYEKAYPWKNLHFSILSDEQETRIFKIAIWSQIFACIVWFLSMPPILRAIKAGRYAHACLKRPSEVNAAAFKAAGSDGAGKRFYSDDFFRFFLLRSNLKWKPLSGQNFPKNSKAFGFGFWNVSRFPAMNSSNQECTVLNSWSWRKN